MADLDRLGVMILSCVGGGPMERLARRLSERGLDARVLAPESPESWRKSMAGSGFDRLRARFSAFVRTPVQGVLAGIAADDTVLVPTTNPFFLPAVLVATRWLHGRPVVPLVYDLWPDALEAAGTTPPPAWLAEAAAFLNRFTFRHADAVVFIGAKMAEHACARYGRPDVSAVLETGADAEELAHGRGGAPESELEHWLEGKCVISYVGNLGHVHDVDTLKAAVPRFIRAAPRGSVAVVIAGSGPGVAVLRAAWSDLGDSVRFEAPLPDRAWARLLARSHVSVATLRAEAGRTSIPSKALSAMGAGSALLAICPADSDLGALVAAHGAGWQVAPGDVDGAARALASAVTDPDGLAARRRAAREAAVTHYDIGALAGRWEPLLRASAERRKADPIYDGLKRLIDIAVSGTVTLGVLPIVLGAAIAVAASMGRPVVFRQERPGKNGLPFFVRKFRTMRAARADEAGPEHDAVRLTRVGRFLRASSIDELPTLLNVLRGDMSLVGPRPLLMRYLPRYDAEQGRRHEVPPGVTGWAQVNGRNAISWGDKFDRDVWYVRNRSILLDIRILVRTVSKVLVRDGISQGGHATMPEFQGGR